MPNRTFAATTQVQLGARPISNGTGRAQVQPSSSSLRRPTRSARAPAARLVKALARPKATMNDSTAALEVSPKSRSPMSGRVERSSPTIAPTNALTATSSENCARFSRRPSRTCVISAPWEERAAAAVGGHDLRLLRRRWWDVLEQGLDERLLRFKPKRLVVAALEADRRRRLGGQPAAADRARVVRRVEQQVIGKLEQSFAERVIKLSGHLLGRLLTVGVEVGAAGVADQERIAGQDHPRLL